MSDDNTLMKIPEWKGQQSPSALTRRMFEEAGHEIVKLERVVPGTFIKQDVWAADMLARQGQQLIAIQATDETSHSNKVVRMMKHPQVKNWLLGGVLFFVYSFGKRGKRGSMHWHFRQTQLVLNGNDEVAVL
jgi:hypothetical protein